MQQVAQGQGTRGVEGADHSAGMMRAGAQHVQPASIEGMEHVPHALRGETDARGNLATALPGGAGQHDLRPAQDKGIGRAQAVLQRRALGVRQWTRKQGSGSTHASSIPDRKLTSLREH